MKYEESLKSYISKSKQRRSNNNNLIDSLLSDMGGNSNAPGVISGSGGGSAGVPAGGSGAGHHGQTGSRWGNPDSANFSSQYLTKIKAPDGKSIMVHKNAAGAFKGFLGALYAQGYRPKSISSYNNRNIAGTRTKSEHAWANAIDLDPQANRGDRLGGGGSRQGNLPKNIASLAARYGLTWGGTWKSADPMHFEYTKR